MDECVPGNATGHRVAAPPSPSKRHVEGCDPRGGAPLTLQQLPFSASNGTQIAITPLHFPYLINHLFSSECQCLSYWDPKRTGTSVV